jgi:hypothetical protein
MWKRNKEQGVGKKGVGVGAKRKGENGEEGERIETGEVRGKCSDKQKMRKKKA